jgi:hypothetical protein
LLVILAVRFRGEGGFVVAQLLVAQIHEPAVSARMNAAPLRA